MNYASASRRPNPAALAGALGIPGALGALMVVGLAVTVATEPPVPPLIGETITETVLPPPPPPTPDKPQPEAKATSTTTLDPLAPPRPSVPPTEFTLGENFTVPLGTGETSGTGTGEIGIPAPTFTPSLFDPVGARPKGNAGRWVTNADYKPRWIMEEMAGTARFTLAIDAAGKVTGCTITRSTGHGPLDAATCQLVSKRARFEAARDNTGKPVAGSYTGTITWKIPE
ncbi:energy transducer TonB [Erythrobacter sp. NE805]|uniref:energy transducer TonB n=1 Tax=Erythrobacter sp. NE805 TaxID=3389875 RepID=UPI00396B1809